MRCDALPPTIGEGDLSNHVPHLGQHFAIGAPINLATVVKLSKDYSGVNSHSIGKLIDALLGVQWADPNDERIQLARRDQRRCGLRVRSSFDLGPSFCEHRTFPD